MSLSRQTELTVGSDAFSVSTELLGDDAPIIESRVVRAGQVVYRTEINVEKLMPASEHDMEISHWLDTQHRTVLERLKEGSLAVQTAMYDGEAALEARLEFALSSLAAKDFTTAAKELRELAEQYPDAPEPREFLEVVRASESGEAAEADALRKLKSGAQAYAGGSTRRAMEFWKVCLSKDPASRTYQCLILLASTESEARREKYAQEIISLGGQLLTGGFPDEAHALLLVAQTVEQSAAANQTVGETSQTVVLPAEPPALGEDQDFQGPETEVVEESSDTNPRGEAVEEHWRALDHATRRVFDFGKLPLSPNLLFGGAAVALLLLVVALSVTSLGSRSVPVELLDLASASLNAGQYNEATEAYSRILSNWEDVASAHLGRGRARLALGDEEGGLADLTRAVELEPGAPTSAEELADVLYVRGRYQEAAEYYLRAVDAGSQDAGARHRLASCLVQLNRPDEALAHLEAAITVDSENGEARLLLGTLLNADGRHAEAERELRAARPHIDADGDYFTELGYALLSQDNLDETERVAREFLGFDPGDARAHTLLGEVFLHQRQYEPARIELIRALQTNAKEPRAQIALGRTWLAIGKSRRDRGDLGKARQILESAQEVPEGERLMVLGQVALAEGSVREAVTLLEQSLGIGASELPARLSLADAKARAKDLTGAAAELERARLLSSADPAIPLSLAIAYSQLKDPVRASAEYLKAIQMVGPSTTDSVVIPSPYVSVPRRFDINRSIRSAYRAALSQNEEEPNATALKTLAESTSFVIEKDS